MIVLTILLVANAAASLVLAVLVGGMALELVGDRKFAEKVGPRKVRVLAILVSLEAALFVVLFLGCFDFLTMRRSVWLILGDVFFAVVFIGVFRGFFRVAFEPGDFAAAIKEHGPGKVAIYLFVCAAFLFLGSLLMAAGAYTLPTMMD